jgi:hypothetical protein
MPHTCVPVNHPSSRRQAGAWAETEHTVVVDVLRPCEIRKDDGRGNNVGYSDSKGRTAGKGTIETPDRG